MTTITFTPANTALTVTRGDRAKTWQAAITVQVNALPAEIVAQLFEYGLTQKLADKVSDAKNEAEAEAGLQQAWDQLIAGVWSSRGGSDIVLARKVVDLMADRNAALKAALDACGDDKSARDSIVTTTMENNPAVAAQFMQVVKDAEAKAAAERARVKAERDAQLAQLADLDIEISFTAD